MIKLIKINYIKLKIIDLNLNKYIFLSTDKNYLLIKLTNFITIRNNLEIITNQFNIINLIKWISINKLIINKLTFFGRGYKIVTKKKKNLLVFNKAHIVLLYTNDLIIKYDKKNLIIINSNKQNLNYINNIYKLKLNNIYKKLGIRKNKQIILKKKGKNITN